MRRFVLAAFALRLFAERSVAASPTKQAFKGMATKTAIHLKELASALRTCDRDRSKVIS